jgi:type III pantothenate kinase
MLIAIDVGNTVTMFGAFEGERLLGNWRTETRHGATADEYGLLFTALLRGAGLRHSDVEALAIASVVPSLTVRLQEMSSRTFGLSAFVLRTEALGIRTEYEPPSAVGPDRVANAVAAGELYGLPAIVVDLGTALTVDAISADGTYLGGAIAPGLEVSIQALYRHAALLSRVELHKPDRAIGRTTSESLRSGVVYGFAGQVDSLVRRFADELAEPAQVVATGGQAGLIVDACETVDRVDEFLTLHGLRIIHARESNGS